MTTDLMTMNKSQVGYHMWILPLNHFPALSGTCNLTRPVALTNKARYHITEVQ